MMTNKVIVTEKYERNGWPSVARPDLKPPDGWSLALINSINLIHHHALSPDGQQVAFVWERDGRSDIFAARRRRLARRIARPRPDDLLVDSAAVVADGRWLPAPGGHVSIAQRRSLPRAITNTAAAW
jgi:hypothetical protein